MDFKEIKTDSIAPQQKSARVETQVEQKSAKANAATIKIAPEQLRNSATNKLNDADIQWYKAGTKPGKIPAGSRKIVQMKG